MGTPPARVAPGRLPLGSVERIILLLRGRRALLDNDLARLYGVETKVLKRAVRRNRERFPPDFMFELSLVEADDLLRLRCQTGTLKRGRHAKYLPYAFTQEGVAMLSTVLRSPRAVQVNVAIMRAFVRLREALAVHKDLASKLGELERKIEGHDAHLRTLFDAIRQLMNPPDPPRRPIGFHVREPRARYRAGGRLPMRMGQVQLLR